MKTHHWDRIGNGGLEFTELGFGSAPLGNLYQAISDDDAHATLESAWHCGCRYFDTAPLYGLGLAETRMNRFLRGKRRDDYVLSTKVGRLLAVCPPKQRTGIGFFIDTPARREIYDYSYDGVMRSVEFSLERLGVDRIDILFVHDLDLFNHGSQAAVNARMDELMQGGYYALLSLRDQGVIKAFGAGLNEWEPCQALAERGDFDLFLLAGRYTLLEQASQDSFMPLCRKRGIGIILGGPYNSGILATGAIAGAKYNYQTAPDKILRKVRKIEKICQAHGVQLKEAALRFPLLNKSVLSVIPGGQSVEQVENNLDLIQRKIPPALWRDLKQHKLVHQLAPIARR